MKRKRKMATKKRRETAAQRAERLSIHRERMRKFREETRQKQRESQECVAAAAVIPEDPADQQPFHPMFGTLENAIISEYCEKQEDSQRNPLQQDVPDKMANGHLLADPEFKPVPVQLTRRGRRIRTRKAVFGESENRTKEEERLMELRKRRAARRANETKEQRDTRRQKQRERMRKYRSQMRMVAATIHDGRDRVANPAIDESDVAAAKGFAETYAEPTVAQAKDFADTNGKPTVASAKSFDATYGEPAVAPVKGFVTTYGEPTVTAKCFVATYGNGFVTNHDWNGLERNPTPDRTLLQVPNPTSTQSPRPIGDVDRSVLEPDVILQERSTAVNIPLKICYTTMTVKHRGDDEDGTPNRRAAKGVLRTRPLRKYSRKPNPKNLLPPLEPDITLLEASDGSLVPLAVVQQTHEDFDDMIEIEMESGTSDKQTQTVHLADSNSDSQVKYLLDENHRLKEEIAALKRQIEFGHCPAVIY